MLHDFDRSVQVDGLPIGLNSRRREIDKYYLVVIDYEKPAASRTADGYICHYLSIIFNDNMYGGIVRPFGTGRESQGEK